MSLSPHVARSSTKAAAERGLSAGWWRMSGLGRTELAVAAALVVLMLATGLVRPAALSAQNVQNVLQASVPLVLLAAGQLVVVATAGIDLSVGSVFSLAGMAAGIALRDGHGSAAAVVAGLGVGLVLGLLNGILVAVVGLAAFVVTLVTLSVGASLAFIVTAGNSIPLAGDAFSELWYGTVLGVPNHYLIPLLLLLVLHAVLMGTVPGRWVYAVGSNERAARLVGIPVRGVKIAAYTFSGLCAAAASVLSLSYLYNAEVTSGSGLELSAIAAVVIGGASLFGGRGSAVGALLGALIITAIQNVVNLLGINSFWQGTVTGAVILVAVLVDRLTTARPVAARPRSPLRLITRDSTSRRTAS